MDPNQMMALALMQQQARALARTPSALYQGSTPQDMLGTMLRANQYGGGNIINGTKDILQSMDDSIRPK